MNRYTVALLLAIACGSCIEPFEPEIRERQSVYVINGTISDTPGMSEVTVSRSTPYNDPYYQPVSGCVVSVEDETGEIMVLSEGPRGVYRAGLPPRFLETGKAYSLRVHTSDGKAYRSDYDTLLPCPPIDTLYYELETRGTTDPGRMLQGIRFYSELTGATGASGNFRWQLEETWEYRTPFIGQYIYASLGGGIGDFYTDHLHRCFVTRPVSGIYTASTQFLAVNSLRRNPLNYVSNETPRIKIQYSLRVTQQSLTNAAFAYWDRLQAQSEETGGLYESQPYSITGNMYNVQDPTEKVLGYFYATQQQTGRITVPNDFDFDVPGYTCTLDTAYNYDDFRTDFPYYLITLNPLGGFPYLFGDQACFDCRKKGGVTEIPHYW